MEIGIIPTTHMVTIPLVPPPESIMGTLVHGIFGITNAMTVSQLLLYVTYSAIMTWWVFFRRTTRRVATTKED
jgi:high-affinity Fe2+/Pb2+ permease